VIREETGPFAGSAAGSQQDAGVLVTLVDHVIQVFWAEGLKRFETEVILDQQIRSQVNIEAALPRALCPVTVETLKHFLSIEEQYKSPLGFFLAEGLRKMALFYPGWSADQHIVFRTPSWCLGTWLGTLTVLEGDSNTPVPTTSCRFALEFAS
jgi:hypothetical protein